jgi:uncharacterized protein (TIGR04222 family)
VNGMTAVLDALAVAAFVVMLLVCRRSLATTPGDSRDVTTDEALAADLTLAEIAVLCAVGRTLGNVGVALVSDLRLRQLVDVDVEGRLCFSDRPEVKGHDDSLLAVMVADLEAQPSARGFPAAWTRQHRADLEQVHASLVDGGLLATQADRRRLRKMGLLTVAPSAALATCAVAFALFVGEGLWWAIACAVPPWFVTLACLVGFVTRTTPRGRRVSAIIRKRARNSVQKSSLDVALRGGAALHEIDSPFAVALGIPVPSES